MEGIPHGTVVKNMPAIAGDVGLIPGLRSSSGEGKGNPLDRGACGIQSIGLQESDMT